VGARLRARQELHEKECQMALQDRVQEETNEKKNALEAYIYSLRGKLAEQLAPFASESERSSLSELLDNLEARPSLYLCTFFIRGWCCGLLPALHAA
jgi:heat shock protein